METERIDARAMGQRMKRARADVQQWSLQRLSDELSKLPDPGSETGEAIRLGRGALGKWESGANSIPLKYVIPLSVALGVTPNWLLLGEPAEGESMDSEGRQIGSHQLSLRAAWAWACGEVGLPGELDLQAVQQRVRPHDAPSGAAGQQLQTHPAASRLADAASELRREGASLSDIKFFLDVWHNMTTIAPEIQWDSEQGRPTFGDQGS